MMPIRDENPTHARPVVTYALIAANSVAFMLTVFSLDAAIQAFGFVPADARVLTLFTSMFMHGGIAHILGNMWFLFIFGDNVEDRFGALPFLGFYLLAGLGATLTHFLLNLGSTIPAVGASGAISGVLGAYLVLFPGVKVHVAGQGGTGVVPAWVALGSWFGFQFVSGIFALFGAQSGIAFWAHIGGFVIGAALALVAKPFLKLRSPPLGNSRRSPHTI